MTRHTTLFVCCVLISVLASGCLGSSPSSEAGPASDGPTPDHMIQVTPVNETGDDGPVIQNATAILEEHAELRAIVLQTPQSSTIRDISPEAADAIVDDVGTPNFYLSTDNDTYRVTLFKDL